MKKSILFLLLVATFFSCSKHELSEVTINEAKISSSESQEKGITPAEPFNPFNEFDYFGAQHNQALIDVYADGYDQHNSAADYYAYFNTGSELIAFIESAQPDFQNDPDDYGPYLSQLMHENPVIANYSNDIRLIMIDPSTDLQTKINLIKDYESTFHYSSIDKSQAKILKLSSSVARYSLYLWAPTSEGGLGYIDLIDPNDLTGIDWWEIGVEDFLSACGAALFTGNPLVALASGVIGSAISALI